MGAFYGIRIRNRLMTIKEVPQFWRAKTEKWLADHPE